MGKKGGKKGKKSKKEKEGKKEKKMTFTEALLAFQLQIKDTEIERYLKEVKHVEEQNRRYKERNDRLKAEQLIHIRDLLHEAKKQDNELATKEVFNRDQVDQAIREKWEYIRTMGHKFEELRSQINQLAEDIVKKEFERDYWLAYKNVGSEEHSKQIKLLELELVNIEQNFKEIEEHFRQSLEYAKNKINELATKQMEEKKELATENAIKHIDKYSRKEIKENSWLKDEVASYRKQVIELEIAVQNLEQDNLKLISVLFDCRLEDLKISRSCFLTQVAGLDLPADGLLGQDFETLKWMEKSEAKEPRPKSATLLAVEKTISAAEEKLKGSQTEEDMYAWDPPSDDCLTQELTDILYGEERDFQAYLQLGPLELKLLSVVGLPMPLHHETVIKSTKGSLQDDYDETHEKWPITYERMIAAVS
ncbi:coiled-coil domain-containing protein 83 [Lissotriton helveticus]